MPGAEAMGPPTCSSKKLAAADPWPGKQNAQPKTKPGDNCFDKYRDPGPDSPEAAISIDCVLSFEPGGIAGRCIDFFMGEPLFRDAADGRSIRVRKENFDALIEIGSREALGLGCRGEKSEQKPVKAHDLVSKSKFTQ
jgi:hypothetical protein